MARRIPIEIWRAIQRPEVFERDGGRCVHCHAPLTLESAHVDHIKPLSEGGKNRLDNYRLLCRRCHCLRENNKHRGMVASAIRDGIIPPDWRPLVWRD